MNFRGLIHNILVVVADMGDSFALLSEAVLFLFIGLLTGAFLLQGCCPSELGAVLATLMGALTCAYKLKEFYSKNLY